MHNRFLSALATALSISATAPFAQSGTESLSHSKTAAEAFHNVQVLKNVPADELIPAMQFITYSLGVECSYCHVEGAMEKDDKKPKLAARKMMQMVAAINRDNFDSKQVVTCNSCHRGSPRPVSIPLIADSIVKPAFDTAPGGETSASGPTPDEVVTKYVSAVGGTDALGSIKTRQEKGTITIGGRTLPVEILNGAGGKQLTVVHLPNGDSVTAYDGASGWTSAPNRPAHPIPMVEVASARVETDLQLPLHLKQLFDELKSAPSESIGTRETYVLAGISSGEIAAKFYFDKDSGYLLRILRYAKSPLGRNPTQIDYDDYRENDGVKLPFRYTVSRPNSRMAIQVDDVQVNVPIDDGKFASPATASEEGRTAK